MILVALEASYHSSCITSLYKRAETVCKDQAADTKFQLEGIALAELITYIKEARESSDSITVLELVDLANMYTSQMEQLGADTEARVHTTQLKERLLSHIPELEAYRQGRDIFLGFKEDLLTKCLEMIATMKQFIWPDQQESSGEICWG